MLEGYALLYCPKEFTARIGGGAIWYDSCTPIYMGTYVCTTSRTMLVYEPMQSATIKAAHIPLIMQNMRIAREDVHANVYFHSIVGRQNNVVGECTMVDDKEYT